eukprot:15471379-Alexandrium_andersonii.AAC.1
MCQHARKPSALTEEAVTSLSGNATHTHTASRPSYQRACAQQQTPLFAERVPMVEPRVAGERASPHPPVAPDDP